jgi:hypothetical protein
MGYVTVTRESEEGDTISIDSDRYPVDLISWNPTVDPVNAPVVTRVRTTRYSGYFRRRMLSQSLSQDTRSSFLNSGFLNPLGRARVPKTLSDTNEFISAFWLNGKPKCRKGYTYDFKRKMCRRL